MPKNLSRAFDLALEVPRLGKLGYCLYRDGRVPATPKAVLAAAVGVIVSPLKFPARVPVLGDLDRVALGILAVRIFVEACPQEVVDEHRAAIKAGESAFDRDFQTAAGAARYGLATALDGIRQRLGGNRLTVTRLVEDESA
jgi:uncharacterized membrane protein YkvA (DUF1232 family)